MGSNPAQGCWAAWAHPSSLILPHLLSLNVRSKGLKKQAPVYLYTDHAQLFSSFGYMIKFKNIGYQQKFPRINESIWKNAKIFIREWHSLGCDNKVEKLITYLETRFLQNLLGSRMKTSFNYNPLSIFSFHYSLRLIGSYGERPCSDLQQQQRWCCDTTEWSYMATQACHPHATLL